MLNGQIYVGSLQTILNFNLQVAAATAGGRGFERISGHIPMAELQQSQELHKFATRALGAYSAGH